MTGKDFFLDAVRRDGETFLAAARGADLTAPVPPCPKWTVWDLVRHLGVVYHWQRTHFVRGETSEPAHERTTAPEGEAVYDWFAAQHAAVLDALAGLDPDTPAWNWSVQPETGAFWHRRMAQETAVHRWDAQSAATLPQPIEARLAADGVGEVLEVFLPGGRRMGPEDADGVVRLVATDTGDEWAVRVRGTELAVLDTDTLLDAGPGAQSAAAGTASDLLLALWGRVQFDVLQVEGDLRLLSALRTG
ncbi:MAG TPA: maleylpyruvate isomerase family mycothiol-dependent enzyme [Mycobacteriales bacterium]|jgi:uncharacterized protein (TIGR03083 family)|nr:maleylpyruvate isomerase family mycothiol-dependent enzyme [Mycobacteriales bacterium]